jgi:hypothetical protein
MRFLTLFFVILSFQSHGQNTGLYGRKTILEFQGLGSWPILHNWSSDAIYYKANGSELTEGRNVFDYGARIALMHAFTNQFGLGLEGGIERQGLAAPNTVNLSYNSSFGTYTTSSFITHEYLRMQTWTFMPKFEFSLRSNLLPIGLSHQVGVGYARTSIAARDYRYSLFSPSSDSLLTDISSGFVNGDNVYTGFTVMYQINMRTPITERLLVTYGLRYNAHFLRSETPQGESVGMFDLFNLVRQKRNYTFVQLNIGLGFAF